MTFYQKFFAFIALMISPFSIWAQAVDNNGLERNIHNDGYFRFNYGNDYFTATDYYLTQTIFIAHPTSPIRNEVWVGG